MGALTQAALLVLAFNTLMPPPVCTAANPYGSLVTPFLVLKELGKPTCRMGAHIEGYWEHGLYYGCAYRRPA